MNKKVYILITLLVPFLWANFAFAQTASISFNPKTVYQGEPLMIQVNGVPSVKRITFAGIPVRIFKYKNKPTGLVGLELNKAVGDYVVTAELNDGTIISNTVKVNYIKRREAPYTIPEKLGGTTAQGQIDLVSTLAEENGAFKKIKTGTKIWWISDFESPLKDPKIADEFGYTRKLGAMVMAHKGVDYSAPEGTKVFSINDGIVRLVGDYRNYGKTVIVDHGLGVLSFYLHLSEPKVKVGQFVYKGDLLALSGETGYADSPHLHFSMRIYGVSVDPVKFLELFK
jgi:murein DD-endopeptidase MepM/ murein hydrolase activator NlpD